MQMIKEGYGTNLFFFFFPLLPMDMDKDEIVKRLEDLSQAAILV